MADNERYSPDIVPEAIRITPESIKAFREQSHDFEELFRRLQHENPELAREILVVAEQYDGDIGRKNAFANGVLYIIGLEYNTKEAAYLQQLLSISKEAIPSDGVDGEGQPLSA